MYFWQSRSSHGSLRRMHLGKENEENTIQLVDWLILTVLCLGTNVALKMNISFGEIAWFDCQFPSVQLRKEGNTTRWGQCAKQKQQFDTF